jgi:putative ABC transporter-associated repeat protein
MKRILTLSAAVLLASLVPAGAAAQGQPPPSDSLNQRIEGDQRIADGRAVLSQGHVDIGPRFVKGEWSLMVHDDSVDPSVWRHLDQTVFQVSDKAVLRVPADPGYSFIGEPGTPVHVVPQVQNPDVAWVGWNTQDPEVMETIDGGVTLTLTGVDGPGELFVYLQAGNFGAADVLWDSTKDGSQDLWVDVNTHTHANWVFTKPGVYLVQTEVKADLVDGRKVTDTATLRFAVGDATDVQAAFTAQAVAPMPRAANNPAAAGTSSDEKGSGPNLIIFVIGAVALALIAGVIIVIVRGRTAKRRALSTRDDEVQL